MKDLKKGDKIILIDRTGFINPTMQYKSIYTFDRYDVPTKTLVVVEGHDTNAYTRRFIRWSPVLGMFYE